MILSISQTHTAAWLQRYQFAFKPESCLCKITCLWSSGENRSLPQFFFQNESSLQLFPRHLPQTINKSLWDDKKNKNSFSGIKWHTTFRLSRLSLIWRSVKKCEYIILHNVVMIQKYFLDVDSQCDVKQSVYFFQDCCLSVSD